MIIKTVFIFFFFTFCSQGAVLPSIPSHLLECYNNTRPFIGAPRRLDVFISLLRRLELKSQLDLRVFSASLLRSLRLDGIEQAPNAVQTEFVLPYRASAFQYHRYKILMDIFLPSQDLLQVDESLTSMEKCQLHAVISSGVRRWERGDENSVCPLTAEQTHHQAFEDVNTQRSNSRCPIEDGVIQTDWGTITPGTVVAAIASSLEAQRVLVTDILNAEIFKADIAEPLITSAKQEWYADIETITPTSEYDAVDISNIWVATLAGDLAEVVVNQGPRVGSASLKMVIGSSSRWNDTLLPRDHYLYPQNKNVVDWHMTDAEILSGIDGLILASYIPSWAEQRRTLRLSQVIHMYYSNEGVSFEPTVKACNRQTLFTGIFNRSQLLTETSRFAHILSLRQGGLYIPVEEMDRISEAAVSAFMEYVNTVFRQYHRDCQISQSVSVVDLVVATDASWKGYAVEQFMSWVGGAFEMSWQPSSLALLHGNTGRWIVPPSENLTAVFSYLANYTEEWPTRINLPSIISSTIQHSLNKSLAEISSNASAGLSTVVLVISPTDRTSTEDLEQARSLMSTLRASYFDVYFAYVSQDLSDFQNINNEYLDYSELFLATDSSSVQDVITSVDTYLVKSVIPTRLMGVQCAVNDTQFTQTAYEDFVLPGRVKSYRIHPFYLRQQPIIYVQFRNDGQGQLLACTWRGADASHSCQTINEREVITFNLTTPCSSPNFCLPARFSVTAVTTSNLCANNDCRLPNQVGFYIQQSGLRCLPLMGHAARLSPCTLLVTLTIVISLILFNK